MRNKAKAPNRLDTSKIKDKQTKAQLEEEINQALRESEVLEHNRDVELQWKALRMAVYNTAEKDSEKPKRKHQDCFDETDKDLKTSCNSSTAQQCNNKYAADKHTVKQE